MKRRRVVIQGEGKRDIKGAKKLLAEAVYSSNPVTCLVAQDQPPL
jgi:peptide/nickel transport system substrate-binding protein